MSIAARQDWTNYGNFTNPGEEDLVWFLGDTKTITYNVTFETFTVLLYQEKPEHNGVLSSFAVFVQASSPPPPKFNWIVQAYTADLTDSDIFFFWMLNESDPAQQGSQEFADVSSPYFTIRARNDTSSSTTSSVPTSTATSSSTSTLGTNTQTDSSSTSSASSSKESSNNNMAVGIGVGVSIGVVFILGLLAAYLFWLRVKRLPKSVAAAGGVGNDGDPGTGHPAMVEVAGGHVQRDPTKVYNGELDSTGGGPPVRWELGASEVSPYGPVSGLGASRG